MKIIYIIIIIILVVALIGFLGIYGEMTIKAENCDNGSTIEFTRTTLFSTYSEEKICGWLNEEKNWIPSRFCTKYGIKAYEKGTLCNVSVKLKPVIPNQIFYYLISPNYYDYPNNTAHMYNSGDPDTVSKVSKMTDDEVRRLYQEEARR